MKLNENWKHEESETSLTFDSSKILDVAGTLSIVQKREFVCFVYSEAGQSLVST